MELSVAFAGEGTRTVSVPAHGTVADLVDRLPVSIHEVSVLVDGRRLPADAPLPADAERVRVVRLIQGG